MDKVRLILNLATIAIIAIPIVAVLLAYQGNLTGLFAPPEITEAIDDFIGGNGDNRSVLEPPKIVSEPEYDESTKTFSLTLEYENSLPIDITINSLSGNIDCNEHHFPLGTTTLPESVSIDSGETGILIVIGAWNDAAENHFGVEHKDEEFVDVVLVDFTINVSGIQIELNQSQMAQDMEIPNPAYER